jgi:hypothetical protein
LSLVRHRQPADFRRRGAKKVAKDSRQIAEELGGSKRIPLKTVFKPVLKAPEESQLCMEANKRPKMRRAEGNRTVQQMAGHEDAGRRTLMR